MSKINRFIDMTYWRFKRWLRVCAECGKKTTPKLGRVNFSFSFEKPKRYWHYSCQVLERKRRTNHDRLNQSNGGEGK